MSGSSPIVFFSEIKSLASALFEAILAVAFSVNSKRAIEVRRWAKEVLATYRCIDEKSPESDNIADILKNDEIVSLTIQVGYDELIEDDAELTASEYDALELTAYVYDNYGKNYIGA